MNLDSISGLQDSYLRYLKIVNDKKKPGLRSMKIHAIPVGWDFSPIVVISTLW